MTYRAGNLEHKRRAILDDFAPSVPQIDIETFVDSFLPSLPKGADVDAIGERLYHAGTLVASDPAGDLTSWSAFPKDPAKSGIRENETFEALGSIYDAIIGQSLYLSPAVTRLALNPDSAPYSDRTHQTRPDGYMILNETSIEGVTPVADKDHWEDIAATMEFKKSSTTAASIDVRTDCTISLVDC